MEYQVASFQSTVEHNVTLLKRGIHIMYSVKLKITIIIVFDPMDSKFVFFLIFDP